MDAYLSNIRLPNFKGYFVVRFNKAFVAHGVYTGAALRSAEAPAQDPNVGAYVSFDTHADQVGQATVGTSFLSIQQTRTNARAEIPPCTFAAVPAHVKAT